MQDQLNTPKGAVEYPHSTKGGEREPRANPARCGFRDTGRVSLDVGRLKEVVMPLSEHEQKLLEQLEKQLHEDDPKFASSMGSDAGRSWSTRHLVIGVLATLAGVVLLLFGVTIQNIFVGVLGFVVMGAGVYYALSLIHI